jgi:signal transduction histidine kinase/ligand-binding sensor domain-containing protein
MRNLAMRYHSWTGPAVGIFMAVLLLLAPAGRPAALAARAVSLPAAQAALQAAAPLPETLRFEHITADDGLSNDSVGFIFQDRQGFLWLGTQDGLNRYDGYRFTVFRNEPANPNSLSNNSVTCMAEDPEGMLWIGTLGGGLNRYNPRSGAFTRYLHNPANPGSLSSNSVTALHVDRIGRLWAGTLGGGINVLDPQAGTFSHYRADPGNPYALSSDNISAILEDPSGVFWIGTGGYGIEGAGLDRFDPQNSQAIHYQSRPDDANSLSSNTISALAMDDGGVLWVGTGGTNQQGRGLNRLDTRTGQVARFLHTPDITFSQSAREIQSLDQDAPNRPGSNEIMALELDASGTLWIATWGGGVDRVDLNEDAPRFLHYQRDPYDDFSLSSNNVRSIFQDRTGVLWFGAAVGGLNKINPLVQRFHLYRNNPIKSMSLAGNAIGPMIEDRRGDVWVGTYGFGLDRLQPKDAYFTHNIVWKNNPLHEQANTYTALLEDHDGVLWAGTLAGLAQFDPAIGSFIYFYHDPQNPDSPSSDQVYDLVEDSSGRLWMSTQNGLDWFDRKTNRFFHMDIPEAGPGADLYLEHSWVLWFGTQGKGLFRLDLLTVSGSSVEYMWYHNDPQKPESLGDNNIVHITTDASGELWLATGNGLDHFDAQWQQFHHYRMEDGLVSNTVYCILADDQYRLWISTNAGISRYSQIQGKFRTFDTSDGLQGSEFRARSCLRARDGAMYFGGVNGISAFNPQEITDNPFPPMVAVTGFRVYNQPVAIDFTGDTPIHLSYQQDFITFEFVVLDFHNPQKNQLFYMLDGFDKDWVKADIGRYASYTNLPGGDYVFRVRGSNNDGVWNEEAVAIPIVVGTPLWEKSWFRVGSGLFLALVIFLGVEAYLANIRVRNRRLEELVEHRTTSLRQANERLHQEIVQREKAEAALAQKAAEEAVAAERSRLARDLHDAVTQTLFSASLTAEVLPDLYKVNPEEAQRSTEDLRQLTRGALAEMRTLLLELRPAALTQARYEDLLRQLTEAVIGRARLPVELEVTGQRSLPPDVQVALYRIAQEALNNIVKYARASKVCVELHMSQAGLLLSIRDNGAGFDPAAVRPTSMGMRIMRERAEGIGADLTVQSAPGRGTLVEVAWNDTKTKELE